MAEVSLPAASAAPSTAAATPGTGVVLAAGGPPFANLLTALADPATIATALPMPATAPVGVKPMTALPIVLMPGSVAMPNALPTTALPRATAKPDTDPDGKTSDLADATSPSAGMPDLGAFLALIAAPAQIVATPTRAPGSGETKAPPRTTRAALLSSGLVTSPAVLVAADTSLARESAVSSKPTSSPVAPERAAQALAAMRALGDSRPTEQAPAAPVGDAAPLPAPTAAAMPSPDGATAGLPSAPGAGAKALVAAPSGDVAPQPDVAVKADATSPRASGPAAPSPDPAGVAASTRSTTTIDPPAASASSAPADPSVAPPSAETPVAPRHVDPAAIRRLLSAAPERTEPPVVAASADAQRPTPQRLRKDTTSSRIADIRIDPATPRVASIEAATAATTPRADDPVARQLSIAQDGQWLDALTRDIAAAGSADGQLHFRIDPDHLGSLTVQIQQGSDGASIRLTASTDAARTILADAQPRLVAEARAQGLTLREATVETRSAGPMSATPAPPASPGGSFSGNGTGGRGDQGAGQLQQQSQQQQNGGRQRAPDQPRPTNPAPRSAAGTRAGADLYA